MTRIIVVILCLVILCEGIGAWTLKHLKNEQSGFAAPIGFACFLAVLQLLYYPAQLANLPFRYIQVVTIVILASGIVMTFQMRKTVFKQLCSKKVLLVLLCAAVFLFAFSKCYIDLDFSDSATYLNYIAQNINVDHLNLFNPTNGATGSEWDVLYLFQGYYHFGSFLCWFVNIPYYLLNSSYQISNLVISVWGLGLLYNLLSSMLIINMVQYFRFKNSFFRFCITVFSLFFTNFFYWKVAFAFYGNTYRGFFVALLLFVIYRWIREQDEEISHLIPFVVMAGLACSSSFLFMSFEILYCLAAYLFYKKKPNALFDMTTFIIPIVLYACAYISRSHTVLAWAFFIVYMLYLLIRNGKAIKLLLGKIEYFFCKHVKAIFYVGIPALAAVASLAIRYLTPNIENIYWYSHYFWNFPGIDMVKDYLFIHSGWVDNMLNVLRWLGVILLFIKARSEEDSWLKHLFLIMLTCFLNPLCTIFWSKTVTGIVYYRAFEILFNPFTEIILFYYVFKTCAWRMILQVGENACLLLATAVGQIGSYCELSVGLYTFYVEKGTDVNAVYKTDPDEEAANVFLMDYINTHPQDSQPVMITQSGATRTYVPQAYQVFAQREYFYYMDRVSEEFYQIASRHYSWLDPVDTDYSKTCGYLKEYKVNYILVKYKENWEFDVASDACAVTVYFNDQYKVKTVEAQ